MVNRFVVVLAVLFLLAVGSALSSPPPSEAVAPNVVFLESPDAQGHFPRGKIASSMSELARAMKLSGKELPLVLVLHVAARSARVLGVDTNKLRRNSGDVAANYFEVWIVGEAHPADYTIAFEQALEHHFSLQMTDADRKRMIARVVRYVDATVSVSGE